MANSDNNHFHQLVRAYLTESAEVKRIVAGVVRQAGIGAETPILATTNMVAGFGEAAEHHPDISDVIIHSIVEAARIIADAFKSGGKLLLCGNGGSAADCQHMAAEFVSLLTKDFKRPGLPAIALTTDTSFLTAFANDENFDGIFARQIEALGKPGDVLIAISTSGTSSNVVQAVRAARKSGIKTIALTAWKRPLTEMTDVAVGVPHGRVSHIQEAHLAIEHVICDLVERMVFGKKDEHHSEHSL